MFETVSNTIASLSNVTVKAIIPSRRENYYVSVVFSSVTVVFVFQQQLS